jgi:5'-nucleotidase (lipoprotein e(P4) family)
MINNLKLTVIVIAGLIIITGCEPKTPVNNNNHAYNGLLLASLYNYYAAEYEALAYQAYNIGMERLAEMRRQNPDKENLAVVVDLDETVLNNSPFEAEMIYKNVGYSSVLWQEWSNKANASALPGSLEFLKFADSLNYNIFYVSNRKKKTELLPSMKNLRELGFPQVIDDHFLLEENESNKEPRRHLISENYEIVLLAGDNLGDFYEDSADYNTRDSLMLANKTLFGKKYIVLPNAMYGKWVKSLGSISDERTVDSLLKNMLEH